MKNENNQIVPLGISGAQTLFDAKLVSQEIAANELMLLSIGDFEPLNIKIDVKSFMKEIEQFENDWVEYLPRTDRPNNRFGLALTNLPGKSHRDNPSRPQASLEAGRKLSELDFNSKTIVYDRCTSLYGILNLFQPLGRTFLVKSNIGGYFVPHRDQPSIPRESFRIAVFLNNCSPLDYDWIMETQNKVSIDLGRAYYVNTRKTHRTISWTNESIHLIMNIPFNSYNVSKLISLLQHNH